MKSGLLAAALWLLCGCAGTRAATGPGETAIPESTGEAVAVVDAFQAALQAGDIDRAAGYLDPGVVIMEGLTTLGALPRRRVDFAAPFYKIAGTEGAPARFFATI